ncbi:MAG: hypothetical protein PHW14_03590 [Candidatus Omnitrophica bacterium]|nr:hypothetical protein [Candidatus Omnitrophota bacterium]
MSAIQSKTAETILKSNKEEEILTIIEKEIERKSDILEELEKNIARLEKEQIERIGKLTNKEADIAKREQAISFLEEQKQQYIADFNQQEIEMKEREAEIVSKEREIDSRLLELKSRETQNKMREDELDVREKMLALKIKKYKLGLDE